MCDPSQCPGAGELEYLQMDSTDLWKVMQAPSLPSPLLPPDESTREIRKGRTLNLHVGLEYPLRWIRGVCVGRGLVLGEVCAL